MRENLKQSPETSDLTRKESFEKFQEGLKGWWATPDGEDICPECWSGYLSDLYHKFGGDKQARQASLEYHKKDSRPTSDKSIAETRRLADGWHVYCGKEGCKNEVFVPY